MKGKSIMVAILAMTLVAVSVAAWVIGPSLIGAVGHDAQEMCYKTAPTWACSWAGPKGSVSYDSAGTNPNMRIEYKKAAYYSDMYQKDTKVQVKLNAIPGKPGNDELYQTALNDPDAWKGGCWDGTSNRRDVVSCEAIGGEAFYVLGFETPTTRYVDYFTYDLGTLLEPGFYYVKPLVTRDGRPAALGGDDSGDFSLLISEVHGPIFFAVAPQP